MQVCDGCWGLSGFHCGKPLLCSNMLSCAMVKREHWEIKTSKYGSVTRQYPDYSSPHWPNCGALIHTHQSINYKHSDNLTKHKKFKYMAGYDFFFRIKAQVLMWISCSSNFSDRFVVVYQWHHSQVCELNSGFCWISVALPPTHTCAPSSSGSSSSCSLRFTSPTCSAFSCHPTSTSSPLISPELQLGQRSPPCKMLKLQLKQSGGPSRAGTVPFKIKCLTV